MNSRRIRRYFCINELMKMNVLVIAFVPNLTVFENVCTSIQEKVN